MNIQLWVVGKVTNVLNGGWDFIGVFSEESLALNAIKDAYTSFTDDDKDKYFIAPAQLNKPHICADGSDWEGGYFPFSDD